MKVNRIGGISFLSSSFVQQKLEMDKVQSEPKEPKQDEFVKQENIELDSQKKMQEYIEKREKEFKELIHKPQKFSIEA